MPLCADSRVLIASSVGPRRARTPTSFRDCDISSWSPLSDNHESPTSTTRASAVQTVFSFPFGSMIRHGSSCISRAVEASVTSLDPRLSAVGASDCPHRQLHLSLLGPVRKCVWLSRMDDASVGRVLLCLFHGAKSTVRLDAPDGSVFILSSFCFFVPLLLFIVAVLNHGGRGAELPIKRSIIVRNTIISHPATVVHTPSSVVHMSQRHQY